MKRQIRTLVLALLICLYLVACGGYTSGETGGSGQPSTSQPVSETEEPVSETTEPVSEIAEPAVVLDLSGGWKQTNFNSDTNYQIAMITENTIEVYWKSETDNLTALYWAGTYVPPTSETNEYSWESVNDRSRTDSALLASENDKKTFTHKDGVISYSVTAMGVAKTVELVRSDDVNINVQEAVSTADPLPFEIAESGYVVMKGFNTFYFQYAIKANNPNPEMAYNYPSMRITARDESDAILWTGEVVGPSILPGGTWYYADQSPLFDSEPASVDFELIQPEDWNWVSPEFLDYPGEALLVENPTKFHDKIIGEVINPNDYDIKMVQIVILFRDDSAKLIAGESTIVIEVPAGVKVPFEQFFMNANAPYITDNFEVYAYPWYQ